MAGNVWVGLWREWRARRYSPDERIDLKVRLPASNITTVALGGDDLRNAYVTSAAIGTEPQEQPAAGALFAFQVDVPGQPGSRARVPG